MPRDCARYPVLLIGDRRHGASASLRRHGHVVREFATPVDVPPLSCAGPVGALVIQNDGFPSAALAFAESFHGAHPGIPIVLVTRSYHATAHAAVRNFLWVRRNKPVDNEELHALVHSCCEGQGWRSSMD
jgi:hypothetical protein